MPQLAWVENAGSDSQTLLDAVADGTVDYTIADTTEFALAHDEHQDLRIAFDFPGDQSIAWAASARDARFLTDIGAYFSRLYRPMGNCDDRQPLLRPARGTRIRGRPRLHASFAKSPAALQEMV